VLNNHNYHHLLLNECYGAKTTIHGYCVSTNANTERFDVNYFHPCSRYVNNGLTTELVILLVEAFAIAGSIPCGTFQIQIWCSTSQKWNIKILTSDPESTQKTGPGDVPFIMFKLGFKPFSFGNNHRNGFNKTDWSDIEIPLQFHHLLVISHPMIYNLSHLNQVTWPSPPVLFHLDIAHVTDHIHLRWHQIQNLIKKWPWMIYGSCQTMY